MFKEYKATLTILKSEKGEEVTEILKAKFPDVEIQEGQITNIVVLNPRQYDKVMEYTGLYDEKFQNETHLLYMEEKVGVIQFNDELLEKYNDKMREAE